MKEIHYAILEIRDKTYSQQFSSRESARAKALLTRQRLIELKPKYYWLVRFNPKPSGKVTTNDLMNYLEPEG